MLSGRSSEAKVRSPLFTSRVCLACFGLHQLGQHGGFHVVWENCRGMQT